MSDPDDSGDSGFKFPLWQNRGRDPSSATATDLELIVGKVEEALSYFRKNDAFLRRMPFGDPDERRQRMQTLARLLRAALKDPTLIEDTLLELVRVQAEEVRLAAMFAIAAASFLDNPETLARYAADGELERFLNWVQRMKASRPAALRVLSKEDLKTLRAKGFLARDE